MKHRELCGGRRKNIRRGVAAGMILLVCGCVGPAVSASEAAEALDATVADPEHGVVILTQQVAASMRKQVDAFRLERDRPLLVEIPGRDGPLAGRKTLRHLVHAAVGVRLDKREGT